jgi:hypothetical protein
MIGSERAAISQGPCGIGKRGALAQKQRDGKLWTLARAAMLRACEKRFSHRSPTRSLKLSSSSAFFSSILWQVDANPQTWLVPSKRPSGILSQF